MGPEGRALINATVIAATAIAIQVVPLFWGRSFAIDWINHVWLTQYFADYLMGHGTFPSTLDVQQTFGNPSPLFYGVFFYPLLSFVAVVTGADVAMRIFSIALLLGPLLTLTLLFQKLMRSRATAILLAVTANSSIYQMTNLYSRSAMTEFFANQFLLVGLSLCVYGLLTTSRATVTALILGVACITIAAGTHPITLYTFVIFTAPVAMIGLTAIRGEIVARQFLLFVVLGALSLLIISPWLYNIAVFKSGLQISTSDVLAGTLHYFPSSIDSMFGRLGFFYHDPRVAAVGIDKTSTPFLDAPFSAPLTILFGAIAYRVATVRPLAISYVVLPATLSALLLFYVTRAPPGADAGVFPGSLIGTSKDGVLVALMIPIQFAYRLAGAFHLALLAAIVIGIVTVRHCRTLNGRKFREATFVAAVLSLAALSQKLYTTNLEYRQYPLYQSSFRQPDPSSSGSDMAILLDPAEYISMIKDTKSYPRFFYAPISYSTPGGLPKTPQEADLEVRTLVVSNWAEQSLITCSRSCVINTNVLPSPSTRISVNHSAPKAVYLSAAGTLDVLLEPGVYQFSVVKVGRNILATQLSIWIMLSWFLTTTFYGAWIVLCALRERMKVLEFRLSTPTE